jgi:hypothetical protein
MKRRNFFGKLAAVTGAVVAAPQVLATAEKSAREFHKATKAVDKVFAGDLYYFDTLSDTLYVALFTSEPETIEVYTEGAASPNHIHVAGIQKEATYKGYSRVPVGRTEEQWKVIDGTAYNKEEIVFPECTGGWNQVTHIGVCMDEESDPIMSVVLSASVIVSAGITPNIEPGSLSIEI